MVTEEPLLRDPETKHEGTIAQRASGMLLNKGALEKETSVSWRSKSFESWMEMYRRLVAYEKIHGHTRVPKRYKEDPKLGRWVSHQRSRRSCKDKVRIDLLNEIKFEWKLHHQDDWMEMYRRLLAYKKIHGNTRIPQRYKEDPKLGKWVSDQRSKCKDKDRIYLLNDIGFVWRAGSPRSNNDGFWMEMYGRLVAYEKTHGDTRVPFRYKEDPRLGRWVSAQRRYCKNKDRIDLLKKIGFEWVVRDDNCIII